MVALDAGLHLGGFVVQKPAREALFHQARRDVPIGPAVVLSPLVDFFDGPFEGPEAGGLDVVKGENGEDVLMAQFGQVGGKIGELEKGFEGEKAGFDAPAQAVKAAKMGVWVPPFVQQRGQQHFDLARREHKTDEPIGERRRRAAQSDAQHPQRFQGAGLEPFADDLLAVPARNKGFERFALPKGHPHEAIGAKMLVQKRDDLRGIAPVVDHQHVGRDGLGVAGGDKRFGNLARMQTRIGDDGIEQVVAHREPGGRHPVVLVAVPAERLAQTGAVRQAKARAVGGPEPEPFPAFGFKRLVKSLDRVRKPILKKPGQQFFPGLGQGAFRGGKRVPGRNLGKKRIQFHRVAAFEQTAGQKCRTVERQQAAAREIPPRALKIQARPSSSGDNERPDGLKITAKVGGHD